MSADGEPRLHRVTLAAHAFFEIEVAAHDRHEAERIARAKRRDARLKFKTSPEPCRVEILRMVNPADAAAGMRWEEVRGQQ